MTSFKIHTVDSAPEKSREILEKIQTKFGFIPNVMGEIAESPALLKGYWELTEASHWGSFSPTEMFVVQMTSSTLNDARYNIAERTTYAAKCGISHDVIEQLRHEHALKDHKLEALRQFTRIVMKKLGRVEKKDVETFIKAGYKPVHVMEVLMHLSLQFIPNYVSLITGTELDKVFEPNRIEDSKKSGDKRSTRAA